MLQDMEYLNECFMRDIRQPMTSIGFDVQRSPDVKKFIGQVTSYVRRSESSKS
jgi:hypothetical protein